MIEAIDNATVATLRQWWIKIPKTLLKSKELSSDIEENQRYIYDEIAFALSKADPEWVEYLSGFADSNDVNRRCSALFVLSTEAEPTNELKASLLAAFRSKNTYLKGSALQALIQIGHYPLADSDLADITDEWLSAWAMQYRCLANPKNSETILTDSLKSENNYLRKFACSIIGELEIEHLKPLIKPLIEDPDQEVASTAAYNYYLF